MLAWIRSAGGIQKEEREEILLLKGRGRGTSETEQWRVWGRRASRRMEGGSLESRRQRRPREPRIPIPRRRKRSMGPLMGPKEEGGRSSGRRASREPREGEGRLLGTRALREGPKVLWVPWKDRRGPPEPQNHWRWEWREVRWRVRKTKRPRHRRG
jgi:hypothetical protein